MDIKIRGKRVDTGPLCDDWVYGTGVTDFLNIYGKNKKGCWLWANYTWVEVIPESVGQWTGLKDVYDDDFCLISVDFGSVDAGRSDLRELKVHVFYDEEMFAWCWHWKDHNGYGNLTCAFSEHEFEVLKILSNITDNPELLEG